MDITAKVIGQSIIMPVNTRGMIAKAEDYVRFVFIMSKEWDDLTVMAQFQQFGNTYDVYLDDEGGAKLPSSIVDGACTIALLGVGGNTIATTGTTKILVKKNYEDEE